MASITNPKDYQYGNYANQPVPQPTTPNYNSDTLINGSQGTTKLNDYIRANMNNADWKPTTIDDYAKKMGWNVNYSGGSYADKPYIQKLTITNPTTGQSYTLDNNTAGYSQGFGGLYNGKTIMRDTNFITNYLGQGNPQTANGQPTITNPKDYVYGNYAPQVQQQNTQQVNSQPQQQAMQIRELAQQQGWQVSNDEQNRTFTVMNPQTGQQITLPYDTREYGFGGLVNGFNTVNYPSQLINMLNGQAQSYSGTPQQGPNPTQGTNTQHSDFSTSVNDAQSQMNDTNAFYRDLILKLINNKPQYDNSDIRNQYLNTMQDYSNAQFNYDPNTDTALQQAQQQSMYANENEMNRRGILNSTVTTDRNQKLAQELIPVYREQARKEFDSNLARKLEYAKSLKDVDDMDYRTYSAKVDSILSDINTLSQMSSNDLKVIQSNLDNIYKLDTREREKQAEDYKKAVDRTEWSGSVSNKDAVILGVAPGTTAPSIVAKQRENKMALQQRAAEQTQDYEIKKQQLNEQQKTLAAKSKVMNTIKDALKGLPPSQALQQLKASANDLIDKGVDIDDLNAYAKELETAAADEIKSKVISTLSWRTPEDALNVLISSYDDLIAGGMRYSDYADMVNTLKKDIEEGKKTAFDQEMKRQAQQESQRHNKVTEGISYGNLQETQNKNAAELKIKKDEIYSKDVEDAVKDINAQIKSRYVGKTTNNSYDEDGKVISKTDYDSITAQDRENIKTFIGDIGQKMLDAGVPQKKVEQITGRAYSENGISEVTGKTR